jgi:hypothetical protein
VAKKPNCKSGEELVGGKCVPKCKSNEQLVNGKCVAKPPQCKKDEELVNGKCVAKKPNCKKGEHVVDGKCVPECRKNEQLVNGKCVPKKKSGALDGNPGSADLAIVLPALTGEDASAPAASFPWRRPQAASALAWSALRAVSRVPDTMSCSTSCSLVSRM